jgi:hypothetical protein
MAWRIKTGQIQGLNLSYYKVELQNNISFLEEKVASEDPSRREVLQLKLRNLQHQYELVSKALRDKTEKGSMYVETQGENGQIQRVLVEELEKKIAAEEWKKEQEFCLRHPEYKKNNYFMKSVGAGSLAREDSINDVHMRGETLTDRERE